MSYSKSGKSVEGSRHRKWTLFLQRHICMKMKARFCASYVSTTWLLSPFLNALKLSRASRHFGKQNGQHSGVNFRACSCANHIVCVTELHQGWASNMGRADYDVGRWHDYWLEYVLTLVVTFTTMLAKRPFLYLHLYVKCFVPFAIVDTTYLEEERLIISFAQWPHCVSNIG